MQNDTNDETRTYNFVWLYSPFIALLIAILISIVNDQPGLDGAARATAVLFWFFPVILYCGHRNIVELHKTSFSKSKKIIIVFLWLILSLPIGLASLFGIALISETGFGILIR